jgi:hypothetical protein
MKYPRFLLPLAVTIALYPLSAECSLSPPAPVGESAKLFYFEIAPSKPLKLEFTSARACRDPVSFDRFESYQEVRSPETGALTRVRVIHLYAHSSAACAGAPNGLSQMALSLDKDPKVPTRVYLTADANLSLKTR